jgi:hypothetical protein
VDSGEFPEVCRPAGEEAAVALVAEVTAVAGDMAGVADTVGVVAGEKAVVAAGAVVDVEEVGAGLVAAVDMVEAAAVTAEEATVRSSASLLVKRLSARTRLQSWDEAG